VTGRIGRGVLGGAGVAAALGGASALLARGALTIDLGIGRTLRPLGPLSWQIEAPPEVVFDVIAAPYLERRPRALEHKLRVVERGADMVLAEHFTQVGRLVATTLETVRFERPHRISFRLVRGPVPHAVEQFLLRETEAGTELEYSGELGTDLWALGRWWGERVARRWEAAVRRSLDAVKGEAERRAARGQPGDVHRAPSARFPP
jgi:Polyketide cyclase / dehydrase and lipid transport